MKADLLQPLSEDLSCKVMEFPHALWGHVNSHTPLFGTIRLEGVEFVSIMWKLCVCVPERGKLLPLVFHCGMSSMTGNVLTMLCVMFVLECYCKRVAKSFFQVLTAGTPTALAGGGDRRAAGTPTAMLAGGGDRRKVTHGDANVLFGCCCCCCLKAC